LFVGTIEPRKNLTFLLELFSLIDKSYTLIIAGGKGWGKTNEEIQLILEQKGYPKERVAFTGYVSSDDLIRLYNNAFIFISTSHNEGLGLPQLEAMACGCPVLSPHNSAMTEVVEGAGLTVNSWDFPDWLLAIKNIEANRENYVNLGYERLKNYNWDSVIREFYTTFKTFFTIVK
jgi:glycosyltransferase involved in cell wall biosynthesis